MEIEIGNKEAFWAYHIKESKGSDLTQSEYCRQKALSLASFYYWKRRLLEKPLVGRHQPPQFVRLNRKMLHLSKQTTSEATGIRIHIGPYTVETEADFDGQHLQKILQILAGL